eukprot:CAMPEP_0204906464 /NCGR_PEP_ID=MMETSP1397-20131031/5986_1 /ASSEMBLY_ACC=CAM_ASM_000891 /TAXON_ID=49980 /ORGANISM="Climacostomum Climacostomum virens, Strain Stock W-24" /LENGTH=219 /DNA_ID=CAMNT_0052075459 /DNA_START=440 /DNA_END=1099 /DNA_ORIENTATION=-
MVKSKRDKAVSLTQVKKKGRDHKSELIAKVQALSEQFPNIFVVSYQSFITSEFQKLREELSDSKFLLGKISVLRKALGLKKEDSLKPRTYKLGEHLKGNCGLLFTSRTSKEMRTILEDFNVANYLQAGQEAKEELLIPEGVGTFDKFANTIEPYLRTTLGLPTRLHEGRIHMLKDYLVCRQGEQLSVEKAKILKLLDSKQGEFRISLVATWSKGKVRAA